MNEEMIAKAKEAKSVEELIALAKENNIELGEEQAKEYFTRLHSAAGELADNELDNVAGGGCGRGGGKPLWCPKCWSTEFIIREYTFPTPNGNIRRTEYICKFCGTNWKEEVPV